MPQCVWKFELKCVLKLKFRCAFRRWQLPQLENSALASTANELRQDRHTPINPEKLKAAAEGLAHSMSLELSSSLISYQVYMIILY